MANTYTQIYIHYVFAVQNRIGLIQNHWRDELYKYMTGTITLFDDVPIFGNDAKKIVIAKR